MGLKLSMLDDGFPGFEIRIIFATFRHWGKMPLLIMEFIKCAIIGAISGAILCSILFEIAS